MPTKTYTNYAESALCFEMLDILLQSLWLSIPTDSRVRMPSDALNAHLDSIVHKCKGSSKCQCFDLQKANIMSKSTQVCVWVLLDPVVPVVPSKLLRPFHHSIRHHDITSIQIHPCPTTSSCIQGNRLDSESIPQPSRT